ncbi:MAG TPA: hypothetical protein VJS37_10540, partial [Terriglobales bacterium]|nr:hypothetical protein [Terriglobales bacterium]
MKCTRWQSVHATWTALLSTPFAYALRLFLGRILHGPGDSGDGQLTLSAGLILALLPLPGAFYAVFLFEQYSTLLQWMRGEHVIDPVTAAMPEEYFFIVLSMVVTGVVAVWRWEAIFPDRRDYANLVHLPLRTSTIFLSNLIAVFTLASILAIDVNLASALLFPLAIGASVNSFAFFVQFAWVHACVVFGASLFSFLAVFLTVGLLMLLLPYRLFRKVSLYLRSAIVGCLVAALATSFAVPGALRNLPGDPVKLLPPVWFLGLAQLIRQGANSHVAAIGRIALVGLSVVSLGSVLIYAISYRRCFARIAEATGNSRGSVVQSSRWLYKVLDHTVLTSPFQRAGYRFVMSTLLRNEQHSLILGGFSGLGVVVASQFCFSSFDARHPMPGHLPPPDLLAIPLILSYSVMLGVRLTFEIPTELRANWTFRFNVDPNNSESVSLALKVMLSFVWPWSIATAVALCALFGGVRACLLEGFVLVLWPYLLGRILLLHFRKIPFTCPAPRFRESAIVVGIASVLGFFAFAIATAFLEYWAMFDPAAIAVLIG